MYVDLYDSHLITNSLGSIFSSLIFFIFCGFNVLSLNSRGGGAVCAPCGTYHLHGFHQTVRWDDIDCVPTTPQVGGLLSVSLSPQFPALSCSCKSMEGRFWLPLTPPTVSLPPPPPFLQTMRRKEERRPEAVNSGESCGTWVASDSCDEDSSSDGGDCDPGSQRLRALLLEAKRAASTSAPSSWCGDEYDNEEGEERGNGGEIEQQKEGERPRERVVGRAASAPRLLQSGGTPGTTRGGAGGVCRGRDDGRGAPCTADGGGDDQDGAAALLAALEDVLLCPPQVLARSSSCGGGQGRAPSLSSLLTRASKPRDGSGGGGGGGDSGAGERLAGGVDDEEEEADAAEAAVKAALAWNLPSRRLSCVLEESGATAGSGGRAGQAATTTRDNGDRVTPKSIPKTVPDKLSHSGGPAFFSPSEEDDGDSGGGGGSGSGSGEVVVAGFGEEGGKAGVASGSGKHGGGGPTPPRRGSGSGESESTQSVGVGSTAIMTTPSRSPMSKGDEVHEGPALTTAAPGGDGGATEVVTREVAEATKFGDDSDHDNDDDDHSGPVLAWPAESSATLGRRGSGVGGGGGGNVSRGSFTSVASSVQSGGEISSSNGRVRRGRGATKSSGDESLSPATRTLNREERIRTVFGPQAVEAAAATVSPAIGSDSSSQLLFAAANRISALPAQERSLLAELDRPSDVDEEEGDGDGDGGGFVDDDAGVVVAANGDETNEGVVEPPSPSLSAEPPLLRVGSGGGDGVGTTPFRYRRLVGLSRRGWPSCVDPARREEWLCPVEFEAVFAMTFAEFRALPSWKRTALKRELLLF